MTQTRTIDLPSDSHFAVAMKSQQQAEREEQQRIKNLVLNYDLSNDGDQHDGEAHDFLTSIPELERNPNHTYGHRLGSERYSASHSRSERSGSQRNAPRARKLQLSDVDWYAQRSSRGRGRGHGRPNSNPPGESDTDRP
jgi:regulator of nonsense transcripts 2